MGEPKKNITALENGFTKSREKQDAFTARHKATLRRRLVAFLLIAFVISAITTSTLVSQASRLEEKQLEKQKAAQELKKVEQKQVLLKQELNKLKDDEYIAELARKNYFLSDEGEIIFNIPEDEGKGKKEEESSY